MECYEKVLENKPDLVVLRRKLINYYKKSEEYSKAITHLYKLISLDDKNLEAVIELGDLLASEGKEEEQLELYLKYDSLVQNNYLVKCRLAEINFHNRDYNKAKEYIEDALKNVPSEKKISLQKLKQDIDKKVILIDLKQFKEKVYQNPKDLDLRIDYIKKLADIKDSSQVVIELNEILNLSSGNKELVVKIINDIEDKLDNKYAVLNFLADLFFNKGNYEEYFDLLFRMSEGLLNPDEKILEGCEKVLKKNDKFIPAIEWLAKYMLKEERWQEMIGYYKKYFSVSDSKPLLMLKNMFRAYVFLDDKEGIFDCGESIIKEDPKDTEVIKQMGKILMDRENYDQALEYFERVRSIDSQDREAFALHREVLDILKNKQIRDLQKAVENEPDNYEKHFELGALYLDFKKLNEAIKHFQRAVNSEEIGKLSKGYLALCLVRKGLFDIAYETIQDIDLAYGTDEKSEKIKEIFYMIGEIFEKNMKDDKAEIVYKKVFMIDASFRDIVTKIEKFGR